MNLKSAIWKFIIILFHLTVNSGAIILFFTEWFWVALGWVVLLYLLLYVMCWIEIGD